MLNNFRPPEFADDQQTARIALNKNYTYAIGDPPSHAAESKK